MRSKIAKKVAALATAISIVCCLPQFSARGADEPAYFKCELKGDFSKCTYAITTDVVNLCSDYGTYAVKACKAWEGDYTFFDIAWLGTSGTASKFTTKFTVASSITKNAYAVTKFYSDLYSDFDADTHDWTYCFVVLNRQHGNNIPQSTFTHEVGHVLGLAHRNNDPNSIMCQEYYGRKATEPSFTDKAGLTFKYRNRKK